MKPTPHLQIDRIDQIRTEFFERLIEEGKQAAADRKRQQATCAHQYTIMGPIEGDRQWRKCERCDHEATKSIRTWNTLWYKAHAKHGDCVVS